ncbi:MAG: sigma-54-dependent Fis family transcriptional regulator [Bacteroidales bacterium]|nr:sigma-54-dependent Fis family transcriptional regulator [Bacteroidales bacterium]MBO5835323.1 sigma-54-dependent Fis family transcriptional regulator [Bacteroidales bacterium]MBO7183476.1 sigma-54-dependent Fis family transcriptional regulator [Bacteroidales bacterium]MBQ5604876.1 sigma-54-dependent Fis family transcriptional regulator [Bacteroidales bacterium]MBR0334731.1 sigma-54-dependent Fis family transcriptional regulator [Bacteroidales bacterium]
MSREELIAIKQRFQIIGDTPALNRAIDIAVQVAPTDLSVLVTGESGSGKEFFPNIIHQYSRRKFGPYYPINCAAIPEGTIDSELFGHEKGAFTGAIADRKGYFEVADGGTIFLDEVAELPLPTQARLLRVLESGEFIRVGASKVMKTNVRVVAATNQDMSEAIRSGRFRADLYYRLNAISIIVPPLRERPDDILRLFRKFTSEVTEMYRMPNVQLTEDAKQLMLSYRWPGNIRELKNLAERVAVLAKQQEITAEDIKDYIDTSINTMPVLYGELNDHASQHRSFNNEREILYQVLFDMKKDMRDLKALVHDLMQNNQVDASRVSQLYPIYEEEPAVSVSTVPVSVEIPLKDVTPVQAETAEYVDASLSLEDMEKDAIRKALERHGGRRKNAAEELNISERTLYRKIKLYHLD